MAGAPRPQRAGITQPESDCEVHMALPQRKEPQQPQPNLRGLEQQKQMDRQIQSGWRFGWWWIWAIVIVLIWYVGYGWGGSGGWLRHRAHTTVTNDAALSGSGAVMLSSTNKKQYIGQAFVIRNVRVNRQASSRAFWIGSATNTTPMLLVLQGAADFGHGTLIDADGRVLQAPPAAQAQQQWHISSADARHMEDQGVYIQATDAQPAGSTITEGRATPGAASPGNAAPGPSGAAH